MGKAIQLAVAVLLAASASAADVPGWTIARDGPACEADFIQAGAAPDGAMLTIAVMPPQHMLLLQHPDFPKDKQTRPVALAFDNLPPLVMEGLGSDHIYGIAITPDIGMALRAGSRLTATIDGKTYVYQFHDAATAMDEAAHCAGTKTLPEVWNDAPKPIPGVPNWMIVEDLAGTDQCSVRRNSPEVNTSLLLTREGRLVVIAGRPDWAKWGDKLEASLAIDDGPSFAVAAFGLQNLVLLPLTDDAVVKQVQGAKRLHWHLPWGNFTAEVEGLGAAEAALRACDARKSKP